jgi:NAD(P)H dehydrogenase (quinone)
MLQFTGFDVLAPHIVYGPARLTDVQRREHLAAFANRLRGVFEEAPMDLG